VLVCQLGMRVGERVRVCGWVQTLRLQRRMQFVVLRDESGAVQLTNRREVHAKLDQQIDALTVGSTVALTGRVVDAPQVKLGGIEVLVDSIEQVSTAEQPLPIAETSNPVLRLDWRFVDLRAPRQHLVFKVGHLFEQRMRMEEELLADAIAGVRDALGRQIGEVLGTDLVVPTTPFPRMTHAEARERLLRAGWRPGDPASADLDGEGERWLSKLVADETGHQFVFVTDYPVSVRPFYHMRPAGDPTVTSSFDLIWNGLEVTTGAQREHRYDVLVAQATEQAIALEPIRHYVNCFRFGCPPHGGLGIGISRLLMKLLDLPSIREATLFFRGPNRLTP
jgi:aspartyl/asparaginyl-tRNA synthetase